MSALPPNSPPNPLRDPPDPSPASLDAQLTIETPEQTALDFDVAGLGSRFLALAIDTLIQIGVFLAVWLAGAVLVVGVLARLRLLSSGGVWVAAVGVLAFFLIYYGYFMLFEAVWNGQTPGKRVIRIRVIKDDGRPIRPIESVGRNLLRIVDTLPFLYAVGIVSILVSKRGKRLGDFIAGTLVVHERTLEDIKPVWQAAAPAGAPPIVSARLTAEDLALVEAFLNRRSALAADVRYNTAAQIVARLRPKLQLSEGASYRHEELLEAVAAQSRSSAKYA